MSGNSQKLIAINYFGGKFTFVDQLEKYFPEHVHFVDLFAGSLAVTLNKKPSMIDTANDINGEVINFFRVLRNQPDELIALLSLTPISRQEYNNAYYQKDSIESDLERARGFYVRARQSFYGLGAQRQNKGWHASKTISRAKRPETVSKWINALEKLDSCVERLLQVQIENQHYADILEKLDFPGAFFYCDPPYTLDCRGSKNDYTFDFTNEDHRLLSEKLHSIQGKAMISGYDSELMNELYADWYQVKFPKKKNNIRTKIVQECIWMNYDPSMASGQTLIHFQ